MAESLLDWAVRERHTKLPLYNIQRRCRLNVAQFHRFPCPLHGFFSSLFPLLFFATRQIATLNELLPLKNFKLKLNNIIDACSAHNTYIYRMYVQFAYFNCGITTDVTTITTATKQTPDQTSCEHTVRIKVIQVS